MYTLRNEAGYPLADQIEDFGDAMRLARNTASNRARGFVDVHDPLGYVARVEAAPARPVPTTTTHWSNHGQ